MRAAGDGGIERGGVDEGLEDRPRLPLGQRVIELAHAVIAPAHQRLHFAGMRIDRHQRDLRRGRRLSLEAALLLDLLIHAGHAQADRLHRGALQAHIDRGVDAERVGLKIGVLEHVLQRVVHHVHEVRSFHAGGSRLGHGERRLDGQRVIAVADHVVLPHQQQHDVAAVAQAVGMAEGVEVARTLDHAGDFGGFGQRDAVEFLAQVGFRRLTQAHDVERAAPAQVHLVGVVFENLFLGELLLQLQGDDEFGRFALPALVLREKEHARRLHAEGGGALVLAAFLDIHVDRFHDADRVEAGVLEEALVFGRSDGVHQDLRDVVELHHPPLFARRPGNRLDQLRLELVLIARGIVLQRDDLRDLAVGEADQAGLLVEVGIGCGKISMELEWIW